MAVAYRLAAIALDDPVVAQHVVHDATMDAWQTGATWPAKSLDEVFARRFLEQCRAAAQRARAAGGDRSTDGRTASDGRMAEGQVADRRAADGQAADPAGVAIAERAGRLFDALQADDRLLLIERFGNVGTLPALPRAIGRRNAVNRRLDRAIASLQVGLGNGAGSVRSVSTSAASTDAVPADPLALALAALFAGRDPESDPSQLRWRLQRSLVELEQATEEQAAISANAGWGFAVKALLVMAIILLGVSVASISALNATSTEVPTGGIPAGLPLTVTSISRVSVPEGAGPALVAATSGPLIATLDVTDIAHGTSRDCRKDLVGTTDAGTGFEWRGDLGGHATLVAGDERSTSALLVGTGLLCAPRLLATKDAGQTWGASPAGGGVLPSSGSDASSITWAGSDPSRPGSVLLAGAGSLWAASRDSAWVRRPYDGLIVGFDPEGRLVRWSSGRLLSSRDEGATWLELGGAPEIAPTTGVALADGVLLGSNAGLWWYPFHGDAQRIASDAVVALAATPDAAFVVAADAQQHPWMATFRSDPAGLTPTALPADLLDARVTTGAVALNSQHALVSLDAGSSQLYLVNFGY